MPRRLGTWRFSGICRALVVSAGLSFIGAVQMNASCVSSSGSWANAALSQTETASFRLTYDATPSSATMDAVSGLSSSSANNYTNLAAAVRFNSTGMIDARSGTGFTAANSIPYSKGITYHFIFDVNISAHSYNVYVVVGSMQQTLGNNLAFRSEQANVTSLNNVGMLSSLGTLSICNIALSTSSVSASLVLNVSPTSLNFGNVGVSSSSDQNITLTNSGTSNVTISKVMVSGAGFTASGGAAGLILNPNQSTTVRATFAPSATANLIGTLTVSSNAQNSPTNIALSGTGVAAAAHTVTLSWNASSSSPAGYNVYVGPVSGGPYSRLNTASIPGTTFVDSNVQSGQTYFFVVTSINSANQESSRSAEAKAVVP